MKTIIPLVLVLLFSCALAVSDDTHVEMLIAPDRTQCYAIVQGGVVRGGSGK